MLRLNNPVGLSLIGSGGFDPAAVAYFAAMTTQEPGNVKTLLNAFIAGAKLDGWWSKLDGGHVHMLGTSQAMRVDFKRRAVATVHASPTWTHTPYRGVAGDNNTDTASAPGPSAIISDFTPSSSGGNWIRDAAWMGCYLGTSALATRIAMGANGTRDATLIPRTTSDVCTTRMNDGTNASTAGGTVTDGSGFFLVERTGGSVTNSYRNNTLLGSGAVASVGLADVPISYCQVQATSAGNQQIRIGVFGGGVLSAGERAAMYARIQTLHDALVVL